MLRRIASPSRRDVEAEHGGAPRRRREQAAQDADQRRLARAVRAEQAVDLAARDRQADVVERDEVAELARDAARRRMALSSAAAPAARSSAAPGRTPPCRRAARRAPPRCRTRVANTWSARSSAVCRLRGEYSPTLVMCSTTPVNVWPGERVDGDRHLAARGGCGRAASRARRCARRAGRLEQRRGRRVGREDVAGAQIERLDARGARRADGELVEHHVDLLQRARGRRRPAPSPTSRPAASRAAASSSCARSAAACASALRSASVALSASTRVAGAAGEQLAAARSSSSLAFSCVACCACRRACASAISARRAVGSVRLATFSSAPSACCQLPLAIRRWAGRSPFSSVTSGLPGRDRVALADVHLLDAAADARADLDRARLDRAAPLERRAACRTR